MKNKTIVVDTTSKEQVAAEAEKAEQRMDVLIENAKNAGIKVDEIASVILHEFRISTERFTKDFYKLAKKQKATGKDGQILKFTREKIFPFWKKHVLEVDPSIKDIMDLLDKKVLSYYISGIFIIIHSKEIPNISKKVKATVSEMAAAAVKEAIDQGIIKPGDAIPE